MPDWMMQFAGPIVGGGVTGVMLLAGLRAQVGALTESVKDAHRRIDDHVTDWHRGAHA